MRSMKKQQAQIFITAFSRLDQSVVMKYKNGDNLTLPENIYTLKWLPQNDLLGKLLVEKAIQSNSVRFWPKIMLQE